MTKVKMLIDFFELISSLGNYQKTYGTPMKIVLEDYRKIFREALIIIQ
jgi:hypothetical protein